MQIATQHAKGKCVGTGKHVKERLLLSGIARNGRDIVHWHSQVAGLVEANLADAAFVFFDETAMAAGKTAESMAA